MTGGGVRASAWPPRGAWRRAARGSPAWTSTRRRAAGAAARHRRRRHRRRVRARRDRRGRRAARRHRRRWSTTRASARAGTVADNDDDEWHRVLDVNVVGMVRASRAALPHLRALRARGDRQHRLDRRHRRAARSARSTARQGRGAGADAGDGRRPPRARASASTASTPAPPTRRGCGGCSTRPTTRRPSARRSRRASPWAGSSPPRRSPPRSATSPGPARRSTTGTVLAVDGGMQGLAAQGAAMTRALGRGGLHGRPLSPSASAPIGNLGRVVADDEGAARVDAAWDAGVRYFDTAPHYGLGLAERRLGEGARRARRRSSSPPRSAACSTPGDGHGHGRRGLRRPRTHVRVRDYSRDGVLRSLESSLERLGLDRVDIALRPRPRRLLPRGARRAPSRRWRSCARRASIASYGAGMNQSEMLARLRPRDRPRRDHARRPLHAARAGRARRPAAGVRAPRRVGRRRRRVQLRPARAPSARATDATYNYEPAPPEIARARAPRSPTCSSATARRLPVAAAQFALAHPGGRDGLPRRALRRAGERNAALFDEPVPDDAWASSSPRGCCAPTPRFRRVRA